MKIPAIQVQLSFTDKDIDTCTDLGCVQLSQISKSLGYGRDRTIKGNIVVDKKTGELIYIDGKQIIFDIIINHNEKNPQKNYFLLRYGNEQNVVIYTAVGKRVELKDYIHPKELDFFCGKYVVVLTSIWNTRYNFFNPTTGEKLDIKEMLEKEGIKYSNMQAAIKVKERDGDVVISFLGRNFIISEKLELKELT